MSEGVAGETIEQGIRPALAGLPGWVLGTAAMAAVVLIAVLVLPSRDAARPEPAAARAALPPPTAVVSNGTGAGLGVEESDVWDILTSAASEMPIDDAHAAGMAVPPSAIDAAVQRLSPEELDELGRLLKSELKLSGA